MALRDFLNLASVVSVIKVTNSNDGMGGVTSTSSTTVIPLCTIWQNTSDNKWLSDEIAKDSSHLLVTEHNMYSFNDATGLSSIQTIMETISYNGDTYTIIGHCDDVMFLGEIDVQGIRRISQ